MITEYAIRALLAVVRIVEGLVPDIPWPDWLSTPADWMESAVTTGAVNLNALFAYIHPITVDIALLTMTLRAGERIVRRIRALLSTATGGGGVAV